MSFFPEPHSTGNQISPQDQALVDFLYRYAPSPPPAAPDLEDQVFQAIATPPKLVPTGAAGAGNRRLKTKHGIGMGAIVAALAGFCLWGIQLNPGSPTTTELAYLVSFWESSWQGSIAPEVTDLEATGAIGH